MKYIYDLFITLALASFGVLYITSIIMFAWMEYSFYSAYFHLLPNPEVNVFCQNYFPLWLGSLIAGYLFSSIALKAHAAIGRKI